VLEDLKLLVDLQVIDARLYELRKDRERLPKLIGYAGETLREIKAEMDAAQAELDQANKDKRAAEDELQAENEHLNKLKLRTTEIKTNKEYFAHLKEIEDCQKKITKVEETELQLMEKVEQAEALLVEKKKLADEEEVIFNKRKVEIEGRFTAGDEEIMELAKKREEVFPKVTEAVAQYYNNLLHKYPESAVVEALNTACTGCRMMIPPQMYNNVRKGESIIKCNNCRRILFYKEEAKEAVKEAAPEKAAG
jgi:predicted  nucleic acid-binding Zn-ribbon protein